MLALENVVLSAYVVSMIISVFIPIVTGLITKYTTSPGVKGLLTLILNAVQTLIVAAVAADGTAVISGHTLITFLFSLVISIAMYVGVYRPLNITSSTPDGKLAPNKGLL